MLRYANIKMMKEDFASIYADKETLDKIFSFYQGKQIETKSPYEMARFFEDGVTIIVYSKISELGQKVLFQGKKAQEEASIFGTILPKKEKKGPSSPFLSLFPQIGSDEVGTGDFFGPIIVTSSYVDIKGEKRLKELGVTDSKKMNDAYIVQIGPILIKEFEYSSLCLDNLKYNELVKKGLNMNEIKSKMHNACLLNLYKKHQKAHIYVDQFVSPASYYSYLKEEKESLKGIHFSTKGESLYPSVALSSVLSRYSFLRKMEAMGDSLGQSIPLGAGVLVDEFASRLVKKIGKEELRKYVKENFANYKKL